MIGVFALKLVGSDLQGNQWNNVLHYRTTGASTNSGLTQAFEIISAWEGANQAQFLDCLASDVFLHFYSCRQVDVAGNPTAVTVKTPQEQGTRPTHVSAMAIGPQINMYAATGGARVGKQFMPGIASGDLIDSTITPTLEGLLLAYRDALIIDLGLVSGDIGRLVIWSPPVPPNPGQAFTVTNMTRAPKLAVLGRRLKPVF